MKARLKNYRQSPRKVRLVADLVRGKSVERALTILSFLDKKAALPVRKLITSAVANAEQKGVQKENLTIRDIQVNPGFSFVRYRARARGRAAPIRKRSSHVDVVLSEGSQENTEKKVVKSAKKTAEKKVEKKAEKKETATANTQ